MILLFYKNMGKRRGAKTKIDVNSEPTTQTDYKSFVIDSIDVAFGKLVLLENTKLTIQYGEHYGLIGKNGIGKTALLNAIAQKTIPIPERLDIIYVRQEQEESCNSDTSILEILMSSNERLYELNKRYIELETQLQMDQDLELEIVDEFETLNNMIGSEQIKSKVLAQKILLGMGFSKEDQTKGVSYFSGGWRMRISLAKALFMTPTLLILDEPTNHLDLHANLWLTEYLKTYPKTVLVVSHDRYFIDEVCTVMIHINNKRLNYYRGNYDQFQRQLTLEKEKHIKDWTKYEKRIISMRREKKSPAEITEYISTSKISRPEKDYTVKINFIEPTLISDNYITIEDLSFNYPDGPPILSDINLNIHANTRIAIVGPNGAGKSTFLKLLVKDLIPSTGQIITCPVLRIGYYSQHFIEQMPFDLNGVEYLASLNKDIDLTMTHKYLHLFGLESDMHKIKIGQLSGGQKARVKLASFGVTKPHLLILDEPTNHLDIVAIESLVNALNNFSGAIILVTHNYDVITRLNCELLVVNNGLMKKYNNTYQKYVNEIYNDCMQADE